MSYAHAHQFATGAPLALPPGWKRYEREFPAKATLTSCEVQGDYVHVVQAGWACRSKLLADGRRQIIGVLLTGDVCGLSPGPSLTRGLSICSLAACRVAVVPRAEVLRAVQTDPELAETLWSEAARQEAILAELIVSLGRRSAVERTSHLLCELALRQRAGPELTCELPLTQADLGELLGLSVVHVNRVLQILRRRGLIELQRGQLRIFDLDGLQGCGGFKPDYLAGRRAPSRETGPARALERQGRSCPASS